MNPDVDVAAEAFRRGASGYLLKTCAAVEMVTAVREVLRGKSYLSQTLPKETIGYLRRQGKEHIEEGERLTERQREVLQLLAEGKVMKEVGSILGMTTPYRVLSQVPDHECSGRRRPTRNLFDTPSETT